MPRTFIQVLALSLTLVASWFLLKSNFGLTLENIAELSRTKWNYNPDVAKSLSAQQADTKTGLTVLLLGFSLQLVNLLWPMRFKDFAVSKVGAIFAVIVSILVLLLGAYCSNSIARYSCERALELLSFEK